MLSSSTQPRKAGEAVPELRAGTLQSLDEALQTLGRAGHGSGGFGAEEAADDPNAGPNVLVCPLRYARGCAFARALRGGAEPVGVSPSASWLRNEKRKHSIEDFRCFRKDMRKRHALFTVYLWLLNVV